MHMKKYVSAVMLLASGVLAFGANGEVNFDNKVGTTVDAPVTETDKSTKLSGTGYRVALYADDAGTPEGALAYMGETTFSTNTSAAGYFAGGTIVINNLNAPGGNASVQVRAWEGGPGSTWESAVKRGQSNVFTVDTKEQGTTEFLPDLVGMQGFSLALVPEPSTIGLSLVGAAGLLLFRRRKNS